MSSAPRVAKHRARMKGRAELLALLLQDTDIRVRANALIAATPSLASALANDPLMLANALQQAALTGYATVAQVGPPVEPPALPVPAPIPTPGTALAAVPKPAPLRGAPTGPPVLSINGAVGSHEHWEAMAAAVGEARTPPAKSKRGKAVKDLKEAGYSPEDITQCAADWKKTMGDVLMTDMSMVSHIGRVLGGPRLGRHSQHFHESATMKHQPKLNLE